MRHRGPGPARRLVRPAPGSITIPNFELAHDLQAAGHRIGVLSNAPDDLRDRFLSNLPVEVEWDAIVVSGEIGMRKPDPGIFHRAAEEIGVPPEHCFFIDDLEENVLGAQKIGMSGYHFTRNNYKSPQNRPASRGHREFRILAVVEGGDPRRPQVDV